MMIALLTLSVAVGVILYAVMTFPRWLLAEANRSAYWALISDVHRAEEAGEMEAADARRLLDRLYGDLLVFEFTTPLKIARVLRRVPRSSVDPPPPPANPRAAWLFAEADRIRVVHYFTGSWSGLAAALRHRRVVRLAVFRERFHLLMAKERTPEAVETVDVNRRIETVAPLLNVGHYKRDELAAV